MPASLGGGVTSGLHEDEISHGTPAALRALGIINLETILTIELIAAAQAHEFQNPTWAKAAIIDGIDRDFRG